MLKGRGRGAPPPPAAPAAGPRTPPGPQPRRKVKTFFWDKLPDNRVPATFWDSHSPAYTELCPAEVIPLQPFVRGPSPCVRTCSTCLALICRIQCLGQAGRLGLI